MAVGRLVRIDLVAALQQQRERRAAVIRFQPRPHQVPLGRFAVQVAVLLAIAGHEGDADVAVQPGDDGVVAPVQVIAALGRGQGEVVPPDCQPGDLGKQDRLAVTPGSPKRTGRRSALRRDRDGRKVQAIGIAAPKMQDRTRETLVLNHMLRLVLSAP